jgi:hypothetical protein
MIAFLADMRKTIVPDRHSRNGPLPPLLISWLLRARSSEAGPMTSHRRAPLPPGESIMGQIVR